MAKPSKDLSASLAALDAALKAHAPDAHRALKKGATSATLARLEKALGAPLADDAKAWFAWHDGVKGQRALAPEVNLYPLSAAEALDAWKFLGNPKNEVLKPWKASWLPLFANGAGDYVVFETAAKGRGSLVHYYHDDALRPPFAKSLAAWAGATARAYADDAARAAAKPAAAGAEWTRVDGRPSSLAKFAAKPPGTTYRYSRFSSEGRKAPVLYLFWKYAKDRWLEQPSNKNDIDDAWKMIESKRAAAATNPYATHDDRYVYFGRIADEHVKVEGDPAWSGLYEGHRKLPK